MIKKPDAYHKYHSAKRRFLKSAIEDFFKLELPHFFGPNMISRIADELINIFERNNLDTKTLTSGQILWRAVHKDTRADSVNCRYIPVVLTLVDPDDINTLEKHGMKRKHRQKVIARIMREAYSQGALLSTRDIGLMLSNNDSLISRDRMAYEKEYHISLPHTGNLQDVGSCITHKYQIVYKYVIEKKDPVIISNETNHTIQAVDHYLKDYKRVKLLFMEKKSPEFIKMATALPIHVIQQYIDIINQNVKEQKVS
jgi:Protein of unknown function (DUF1670)